jgi:glycosyltransferase involved in cell wall biosynthesis
MKTVITRSCLETLTPRAFKNAGTLAAASHEVTVLAWDREAAHLKSEFRDGYRARRFGFKAPYGLRVLFYMPVWWCFEFCWLMGNRWDVVHAMDFDTAPPAILAAKLKRKPAVYELADVYEDMLPLPRLVRTIAVKIDKALLRCSSAVILSDEARVEELGGIPNSRVIVINNSPPDLAEKPTASPREGKAFTIFYSSSLHSERQAHLDNVFGAVRDIDGVKLVIAGYGSQVGEVERWASEMPGKVQFLGRVAYTEALEKTMTADLVISLYDPVLLNTRYASGNKLFEAMMCGKPLLMSQGTVMADTVERENCGLVINPGSVENIKEAIIKLKDAPELCRQLGANGRKAYEQKYSWETMQQRLLGLYRELR